MNVFFSSGYVPIIFYAMTKPYLHKREIIWSDRIHHIKGANQLRGEREANSRICEKQVFSHGSIIDKLIMANSVVLMHTNKVENLVTRVILSEVYQEKFSIYLKQFFNIN